MESENVATLRRGFDAVRRGDLEVLAAVIDPSFEIGQRVVPESQPDVRGPEALLANLADIREAFGDVDWKPVEIVDLGERILARVHLKATAGYTALPIAEEIGHVYTFRDGLATKLDIYRSWSDAQRATGLEA
jgi:ketosteroid isomerase-like protein